MIDLPELSSLEAQCLDLVNADADFAEWLRTQYRPIAGGWMY
jgi:hypothetical protein